MKLLPEMEKTIWKGCNPLSEKHYQVIIIGAGIAGLTAAIYAARSFLRVLVLENKVMGGQIVVALEVCNYPGIPDISGYELTDLIRKQAESFGTEFLNCEASDYHFDQTPKSIKINGEIYSADTVIIANGAERRKLGCPGEDRLIGRGVSYCATCDGSFFRGKEVCVVVGGDTALEDALYLANLCSKVTLIHRRDSFRANAKTVKAVLSNEKIVFIPNSQVKEILGDNKVTSVKLTGNQGEQMIETSAVFIAVGFNPNNGAFASQIKLSEEGYIIADESCKTNLEGVFAAGDTRTKLLRQLVTAASDGAVAASQAANYLADSD